MSEIIHFFREYRNKKIALYGLGVETEKALKELCGSFVITGLLDSFQSDGEIVYGLPVLSMAEIIEAGAELIIVIARPGSCKAIARKIRDICGKHGIALFDVRGKNLLAEKQVRYDFSGVKGVTKADLCRACENADVISFDLFDTLVTRRIYEPSDVIELVHARLLEKGIKISDFYYKRLSSEKELSKAFAPSLTDIYRVVLEKSQEESLPQEATAEYLAEVEWQTDFGLLIPRYDVTEIFRTQKQRGKKVYVISDTYYSRGQLSTILELCGIDGHQDILPSCEYKTGKTQRLFDILKENEPGKKILHIGDDLMADIDCARKRGISACHLYRGVELMEFLGYFGAETYIRSLSDKIRIGMIIACLFNSPFQFETKEKRIRAVSSQEIGYLFCAPVICDFVCWFDKKVKEFGVCNVWFGARDGFLIQKIYRRLLKEEHRKDSSVYFLTSRVAAARAGVRDEADIKYIDEMKYHGTLGENLKERFGIEAWEAERAKTDKSCKGLLQYKSLILHKAETEKSNYQKYIEKLDVQDGDIVFFDFVAKGTSQMYIQNLVENHLKGLYFLRLEPENEKCKELDIEAFCAEEEADLSSLFDNYYILETILTAPHPSVSGFSETGEALYSEESREKRHIACFERAQEGILTYMDTYMKLCPLGERKENKELDEIFLSLIHEIEIGDRDFLSLVVEDPFFNRMTKITDVL